MLWYIWERFKFKVFHTIFINKFYKNIVCFVFHKSWHFTTFYEMLHTTTQATYVSFSTLTSQLSRGALQNSHWAALPGMLLQHCCPCQLWPVPPPLAPLWSLCIAASRRGRRCHDCLAFPFWQPGELGVIQNSTMYVRDTVVFVQHIWQPKQWLLHLQLLQRPRWTLLLGFFAKLLECCVAKGHAIIAIRQFFSPIPLLKLINPISHSLCLLLYWCFIHSPFGLHFNINHCVNTLVHCGTSAKKTRYYALQALSPDLPSAGWVDFRPMSGND